MREQPPTTIDMTPAGEFLPPPGTAPLRGAAKWPLRLGLGAAAVAAVAAAVVLAALFLWVASVLLPVALMAGFIAYGAFKYQAWRNRR